VRLVLVSAAWCGVDRAVREILSSARLPDGVSAVAVDADADPHTADRFSVDSIPVLLWVEDGRAQSRLVGAFGRPELDRFVRDCSSSRRDRSS
jgi:thioredoxin-like negative regulator of GroEL